MCSRDYYNQGTYGSLSYYKYTNIKAIVYYNIIMDVQLIYGAKKGNEKGKKTSKTVIKLERSDDEDEEITSVAKPESMISRDKNHVYFHSGVDRQSSYKLYTLIKEAEEYCIITALKLSIEDIPIYIHINSCGGCIFSAFTVIDVIKGCRVPVHSIIEGSAASAATLISVSCTKRYIRANAYALIHQLSSMCWGKMSEIEDEYTHLTELMTHIKKIYLENSTMSSKELDKLLKRDLWLNSDTAIKHGLVDEIWTK